MKKLKIGISGCGKIAVDKHIPALLGTGRVELVAFHSRSIGSAEKAKEASGNLEAEIFDDYDDFLLKDMDVVHICTPNAMHADMSIKAMEAGKHVMVEKPMATSYEDALRMVMTSEKTGKRLSVSLQNRFRKDSQQLKKLVVDNELGDIYHARAHARRLRGVPSWGSFLDKKAQGGGALIDIGVHALDLALWLMEGKKPHMVTGSTYDFIGKKGSDINRFGRWNTDDFTVDDTGLGFIVMDDGSTITLESSWAMNTFDEREAKVSLFGTIGGADMGESLKVMRETGGRLLTETLALPDEGSFLEMNEWVEAIISGREHPVKAREVLMVTWVLEAIYRSSETRRAIYYEDRI